MVDTADLKSVGEQSLCRFESDRGHLLRNHGINTSD